MNEYMKNSEVGKPTPVFSSSSITFTATRPEGDFNVPSNGPSDEVSKYVEEMTFTHRDHTFYVLEINKSFTFFVKDGLKYVPDEYIFRHYVFSTMCETIYHAKKLIDRDILIEERLGNPDAWRK